MYDASNIYFNAVGITCMYVRARLHHGIHVVVDNILYWRDSHHSPPRSETISSTREQLRIMFALIISNAANALSRRLECAGK